MRVDPPARGYDRATCPIEGEQMTPPYTKVNLGEVDDSAPGYGFGEIQEARFATRARGTTATDVSVHRLPPRLRCTRAHQHAAPET